MTFVRNALLNARSGCGALVLAFFASLALAPASAGAQETRYRDGRFLETLGSVTIQRADESGSDEAVRNMPFLPGDRVWTDDSGRGEIVFADGGILWIAERSKVDSLGRGDRDQDERLGLRVFSGSFVTRVIEGGGGFEFRAPGGSVRTTGASSFRIDVRSYETTVSVSEGEILADLGGERLSLRAGERVRFADNRLEGPFRYQRTGGDSFDRWCEERGAELSRMARQDARLPDELDEYADELDRNGDWVYDEPQGYVYVPRVSAGWAPYTYGRWIYTYYGWTWVADEPWGFATSHYGRWGYSSRLGWHWLPRVGFSGAWVGWATPMGSWSNTIGWCALGFNDHPVVPLGLDRGRAVARGTAVAVDRGWSYVNRSDLGRANVHRRRVDVPADEAARATVWSSNTAPDRDFRETKRAVGAAKSRGGDDRGWVRAVGAGSRGDGSDSRTRIYVKPSAGDSTPELRSDPSTTIPSPESRRGRVIGQDGFKEEQNDRKSRIRRDDAGTGSADGKGASDAGAARGAEASPSPDPLLSRFFRSLNRADSSSSSNRDGSTANRDSSSSNRDRDAGRQRSDDSAARRSGDRPANEGSSVREPAGRSRDDSRPRQDEPRANSRPPQNDGQGSSRGSGASRSEPRSTPPPSSRPSSDDQGQRRKPREH